MNIKKTVKALLIINGLQFIAAILLWLVIGTHVLGRVNPAVYLTIGILLLSSLLTCSVCMRPAVSRTTAIGKA